MLVSDPSGASRRPVASFGTTRSQVQILSPRPSDPLVDTSLPGDFCVSLRASVSHALPPRVWDWFGPSWRVPPGFGTGLALVGRAVFPVGLVWPGISRARGSATLAERVRESIRRSFTPTSHLHRGVRLPSGPCGSQTPGGVGVWGHLGPTGNTTRSTGAIWVPNPGGGGRRAGGGAELVAGAGVVRRASRRSTRPTRECSRT